MMNEIVAFISGIGLGLFYFGGLLWTVKKGLKAKRPVLLFISSYLLRLGGVLFGFYLVGGSSWILFALCLLGLFLARFIILKEKRVCI